MHPMRNPGLVALLSRGNVQESTVDNTIREATLSSLPRPVLGQLKIAYRASDLFRRRSSSFHEVSLGISTKRTY